MIHRHSYRQAEEKRADEWRFMLTVFTAGGSITEKAAEYGSEEDQ